MRTQLSKPIRIALVGKMRSGKDTVADILMDLDEFQRVKFSKGIGEIIDNYLPNANANGKNRMIYQSIGQGMRSLDPMVWINYSFSNIDWNKNIIVTDLRQRNEYQFLKSNDFFIVKINSDEHNRIDRMNIDKDVFTEREMQHETEDSIDEYDVDLTIDNDSTIEELTLKLINLYDFLSRNKLK